MTSLFTPKKRPKNAPQPACRAILRDFSQCCIVANSIKIRKGAQNSFPFFQFLGKLLPFFSGFWLVADALPKNFLGWFSAGRALVRSPWFG